MPLCIVILPIISVDDQPQKLEVNNGGLASVLTTERVTVECESLD